ncbi:phosphoadenosine phosphosulfate reductase family protein [Amycolatopsis sp. H6(2020)]|nr:phosphoadenosine phosphosulfate reductase family protein [Amycolatopsis sp. H6(2020)]
MAGEEAGAGFVDLGESDSAGGEDFLGRGRSRRAQRTVSPDGVRRHRQGQASLGHRHLDHQRMSTWRRVITGRRHSARTNIARRQQAQLSRDEAASSGRRAIDTWLPIHDWTENQVWQRIRSSGVPYHPAYDQGVSRLSCSPRVLASRKDLVRAAQLRPELAAEYAELEAEISHRFARTCSWQTSSTPRNRPGPVSPGPGPTGTVTLVSCV